MGIDVEEADAPFFLVDFLGVDFDLVFAYSTCTEEKLKVKEEKK
jgi:hypothetical protein